MDLRKPLVALALAGSLAGLTGCGDNTDVGRGETNCDAGSTTAANNPHDASCQQTGQNKGSGG